MKEFVVQFTDELAIKKFERVHGTECEIVRCRDCKYSNEKAICSYVTFWNRPDDFCSRGERREQCD